MTEKEMAELLGMSVHEYRAHKALKNQEEKNKLNEYILELKDEGYTNADIASASGVSEAYVAAIIEREMR